MALWRTMGVRILFAVLMGIIILVILMAWLRSMVNAPPPEPEATDVSNYRLKYVCAMCGLELRVEKAAKERAPTHCMEPMVLIREGSGSPPLRGV